MSQSELDTTASTSGIEIVNRTENWRQRLLWFVSPILPFFAFLGVPFYLETGNELWLLSPIAFSHFILPILDLLLGKHTSNHDEASMAIMEKDRYYSYLLYIIVPIHFFIFGALAWFGSQEVQTLTGVIICGLVAGLYSGAATNTGHELGHKQSRFDRFLSQVALAVPFLGHFAIEHNIGHHRDVATPEDVTSARMGESIYRFAMREMYGAFKRGHQCESARLNRKGESYWSLDNRILQSYAISLVFYIALFYFFGWMMLPFLLVAIPFGWFQLTSANYIEHYGLLREKVVGKNGVERYESCKPHHSWNATSTLSNLALYQLERHSDHHANPNRPYQILRNFENVPELPTGYFGMYMVAYVPWLWYNMMDKRLLDMPHIDGDLNKVNVDPKNKDKLLAKYATA